MRKAIERGLGRILRALRSFMMSNRLLRNAISDAENAGEFTNIYEHEKMLADSVRTNSYRLGISRHIRPGDVVVDLGTGSGILSLFAAQSGPKKIYAIDHSDFIEIAREIARRNGVDGIEFVKVNSRHFTPPEKIDVILHEQIGDDLFDENMIENLLDLKSRILKPGGRIVPGRFELFLEPVALKEAFRVPFLWEIGLHGIDLSFLKNSEALGKYTPPRYMFRAMQPGAVDHFLCRPEPLLSIDLNDMTSEVEIPRSHSISRIVQHPGTMDGFYVYFTASFDDEIGFGTSPSNPAVNWGNRLFRTEAVTLNEGDALSYNVEMPSIVDARTWVVEFSRAGAHA